ncbi:hypothetical protein HY732_05070 [Candidatus Uhrbacteria bacterium]|nr:hypothetical protein [Candidatus Uhrbacteria bacterium]
MSEIKKDNSEFDDPESIAAKRAEEESEARMPNTPEEMIAATLDPAGCIDRALPPIPLGAHADAGAVDDLMLEIKERLMRYLQMETKKGRKRVLAPNPYAQMLTALVGAGYTEEQLRGLGEITRRIVAELNPLLHRVWEQYVLLTQAIPDEERAERGDARTIEEFFTRMQIGTVNDQRIFSFFGVLRHFADIRNTFPRFDTARAELPKIIDVQDPFSEDREPYWREMQGAYKAVFGVALSLPALAAWQTQEVLNGIRDLSTHTHDESVKTAAEYIGFWLWGEMSQIADMSDEKFTGYLRDLHFAYGDPDIFIALLDSLRVLKEREPAFLCQMLGHTVSASPNESRKSAHYGNALQAAFYRSAHLKVKDGVEGHEDFREFLDDAIHLDRKQAKLINISDDEFAQLLRSHIRTPGQAVRRVPPALALMVGAGRQAYMLRKFLAEVSVEGREALLEELRTATPNEFVGLLNSPRLFPRGIERYEVGLRSYAEVADRKGIPVTEYTRKLPPDIETIFIGRGLGPILSKHDTRDEFMTMPREFRPQRRPLVFIGDISDFITLASYTSGRHRRRRWFKDMSDILWKTTPSEKLLQSKEFYQYLKRATGRMEKSGARGMDNKKANQADVEIILEILNSHAGITREQWDLWLLQLRGFGGEKQEEFKSDLFTETFVDVQVALVPIFTIFFSTELTIEARSHFFQLFEQLIPQAANRVGKYPFFIVDAEPVAYFEWLARERNDESPRERHPGDDEKDGFRDVRPPC